MNIIKDDLIHTAEQGIISREQALQIWESLEMQKKDSPKLDIIHIAYYFGAFIIMSAMGWFMNDAWNKFGGALLALIAITYAIIFILAGHQIRFQEKLQTPGGLLFTLAVWMTPLAIFGIEKALNWWPDADPGSYQNYYQWIKGGWCLMEIGTIISGLIAIRYVKFPFLTFPIAFTLWFISMDLTPLLFGGTENITFETRKLVSVGFGLIILVLAWLVDRKTREDYAFWGYLFGMLAFWGGLSLLESHHEAGRFLYFLINMGLILISILFRRTIFIVFGVIGVFGYIGHLASEVFEDSIFFPLILGLIGGLIMYLGIQYKRHHKIIEKKLMQWIPGKLQRMLPPHRDV